MQSPSCALRFRTDSLGADRHKALACLQGRHIVLVGDSVMRYEYLNLAKWVETGSWLGPEPWAEIESDFKDWTQFFKVCLYINIYMCVCD